MNKQSEAIQRTQLMLNAAVNFFNWNSIKRHKADQIAYRDT